MYKLIFELLTDPLGLPINDLWEYLILLIIGAISFSVGWEVSPGGRFGSIIHWCVRLIAFLCFGRLYMEQFLHFSGLSRIGWCVLLFC